jgi:hypothetical protein
VRFNYAAFVGVEVSDGLIVLWTSGAVGGTMLVPIRAFASADEADAFANEMRNRVVTASAR